MNVRLPRQMKQWLFLKRSFQVQAVKINRWISSSRIFVAVEIQKEIEAKNAFQPSYDHQLCEAEVADAG